MLFLLRVKLYLQWNETSVKEKRCFRENPEPSQAVRAKGMGRSLVPLHPNFNRKLFLSVSNTALPKSDWQEMDRTCKTSHLHWIHSTPLLCQEKLFLNPLQLKPCRPKHKHTDLTSHQRAVLPHTHPTRNSAQKRAR